MKSMDILFQLYTSSKTTPASPKMTTSRSPTLSTSPHVMHIKALHVVIGAAKNGTFVTVIGGITVMAELPGPPVTHFTLEPVRGVERPSKAQGVASDWLGRNRSREIDLYLAHYSDMH